MRKFNKHIIFLVLAFVLVIFLRALPYELLTYDESEITLTAHEWKEMENRLNDGLFSKISYLKAENPERENSLAEFDVKFKLFNLFNIKNLRVKLLNEKVVLAGGECVGISLKTRGVIVVGSNYIITKHGNVYPFKDSGLQVGDVITHISKVAVNTMDDITAVLNDYSGSGQLELSVVRKTDEIKLQITPAYDVQTKTYKLGLWVRDDALGIGTLTFVNPENNNRYGALGHSIVDVDTQVKLNVESGELHKCNVVGVKKSDKGKPGELLGLFMYGEENKLGIVNKNADNGIFGNMTNENFISALKEYSLGGQHTAKPGKATILSCLNGNTVEEFNIEIIKTNHQSRPNNKSMVVKITDPRLIAKTGGIVQGMSGSPILQNNKIIGAITHVFINDPTKGFGLYIDWMVEQ